MASLITAIGITKRYGRGSAAVTALDDVSFSVEKGTVTIILGPSGAGKTTLLNILGAMDVATSGILAVDGDNVLAYNAKQRSAYRRNKVSFVFQTYNLLANLSARENIVLATEMKCGRCGDIDKTIEDVGLKHRFSNYPAQLSGGEQQRVSIARALAKNADIFLCDEPTGALDSETGKMVLALLRDAARNEGKAVIIVTHNSALEQLGDHLIKLKNGKITSDEKIDRPKTIEEIDW